MSDKDLEEYQRLLYWRNALNEIMQYYSGKTIDNVLQNIETVIKHVEKHLKK